MILHPLAQNDFIGVVMAKRKVTGCARAFKLDGGDTLKKSVMAVPYGLTLEWRLGSAVAGMARIKAAVRLWSGSMVRAMGGRVATSAPARLRP